MTGTASLIAHTTTSGQAKIPALTGIRGVAAVWVAVFHIAPFLAPFLGLPTPDVPVSRGYLGVDLFFILSGFVLGMTYAPGMARDLGKNLPRFAIGRAFRILPLHWGVLACILALTVLFPSGHWTGRGSNLANLVANILLVQAWFSPAQWALSWNSPAWSLSTEWLAYFAFPPLAIWALRLKRGPVALAMSMAALAAFCALLIAMGDPDLQHTGRSAAIRCGAEFTAGLFLWRAYGLGLFRSANGSLLLAVGLTLIALAVFAKPLELMAPFGFAALILACASPARAPAALFGSRAVAFLGEISFSLYLTHTVTLAAFETVVRLNDLQSAPLGTRWALAAGFVIAVLAIPILTWRFVEIPGQALGRRLQRARAPSPANAGAVS